MCGLRRRSAVAQLLGLRVRITAGVVAVCCVVCCQVEVSATGRSLAHRSPTARARVSVCVCAI